MRRARRFLLYAGLLVMLTALIAAGFHTAEVGIQALVGAGGPPQTIHVETGDQTIGVTVLGKEVVKPAPTLGDRWSREIETTKSDFGETVNQASFAMGRILQDLSQRILEWVGELAVSFSK